MLMHDFPRIVASPEAQLARQLAAGSLLRLGQWLVRLASRLLRIERPARAEPLLEFYADAGAPEGALYVDGELVCRLRGVTRL
jgi:hypothetical protein